MTKKFARIIYPGSFFAEETVKDVTGTTLADFKLPDNAIGVKFFEKTFMQENGEELWGSEKNHTGWFYRGRLVTAATPDIGDILRSNLKCNNWKGAVQYHGVAYPLYENDVVYWNV